MYKTPRMSFWPGYNIRLHRKTFLSSKAPAIPRALESIRNCFTLKTGGRQVGTWPKSSIKVGLVCFSEVLCCEYVFVKMEAW